MLRVTDKWLKDGKCLKVHVAQYQQPLFYAAERKESWISRETAESLFFMAQYTIKWTILRKFLKYILNVNHGKGFSCS